MGAAESPPSAARVGGPGSPASRRFMSVDPPPDRGWRGDQREFRLAVELPEVLDAEQCEVVVDYIDRFGHTRGRVGSEEDHGSRLDRDVRQVRETRLPYAPETAWLYERLATVLDGCNQERFGFDLRDFDGALRIVDYREGDFYDWHLDLGRGAASRKLSVSVMLSAPEDYEGGALSFPGLQFDGVARGNAVVFPSFLLHGVQPVKRGRRCALLGWVAGPRFR